MKAPLSFPLFFFKAQIWFRDTKRLISAIGVRFQEYLQAVITLFTAATRRVLSAQLPPVDSDCYSVRFCASVVFGFINTAGIQLVQKNHTEALLLLAKIKHTAPIEPAVMSEKLDHFCVN